MFEHKRCAFGQAGAAQSHLSNHQVGPGDVFLFFGLYSNLDGSDRHHRIFGYLQVEEVMSVGETPNATDQPMGFRCRHPHTIGVWNRNNTIYVGSGCQAASNDEDLRLSIPNSQVSRWRVPQWLKLAGLTYHGDPSRWKHNTLQIVSRGQEFVTDITGVDEAHSWLAVILSKIRG